MAFLAKGEKVLLRNFFIFGVCFGLSFPAMALSIDFWVKDLSLNLANIRDIHFINPIHFIIDSAPIILSLTAYLIGKMVISRERKTKKALEEELTKSRKFYNYTKSLLEGDFEQKLDENNEDFQPLFALKEKILQTRNNEKELLWISNGLHQLSEIVRIKRKSKIDTAQAILSQLVKYTTFEIGILYVSHESNASKVLSPVATYAYRNKKYLHYEIEIGEGLIGQCFNDMKLFHITDIPNEYIYIESGLGSKQPDSLILSPLIFNNQVFGVLELACLGEVEAYKIEFIKKASDYLGYIFAYLKFSVNDITNSPLMGDNL